MHRSILRGLCCLALLVPATTCAEETTPLGDQMSAMNDAYKAFRRTKDHAEGAKLAREAQSHLAKSLAETPAMVAKMPEGPEKEKALATYRHMIGQAYVRLCEVELAFLDKDLAKVEQLVEALKDLKKEGHDKFIEEEE